MLTYFVEVRSMVTANLTESILTIVVEIELPRDPFLGARRYTSNDSDVSQ